MNDINFSNRHIFQHCYFQNVHQVNNMNPGLTNNIIGYVISGKCKLETKQTTIYLTPGTLFLLPKGTQCCSFWTGDPDICHNIYRFDNFPISLNLNPEPQILSCTDEIKDKFFNIPTEREHVYKALSMFYDALGSVIPFIQNCNIQRHDMIFDSAKKYIYSHPTCSIPEVADYFSISVSYLYNLFKDGMEDTPNNYRLRVCSDLACNMLTTTDKTLEEICHVLNFSSGSYLRKIIKKFTGQTPREIRKKMLI